MDESNIPDNEPGHEIDNSQMRNGVSYLTVNSPMYLKRQYRCLAVVNGVPSQSPPMDYPEPASKFALHDLGYQLSNVHHSPIFFSTQILQ